jgi:Heterokaryon incompatibility protein (HET)
MAPFMIHTASAWAKDRLASLVEKAKGLILPNDCDVCRKIKTAYSSGDYYSETLGSVANILDSKCCAHKPIIRHFAERNRLDIQSGVLIGISRDPPSACFSLSVYSLFGADEPFLMAVRPELLEVMQSRGRTTGFGQRLDPEWIGSQRPCKWYRHCQEGHRSTCSSPPYLDMLPAPEAQYFIDAADTCLILAKAGMPYVALSYVCDQDDWLKSMIEDFDISQKPGELDRHQDLPKTVHDAVNLLSLLGERYLWVDGLSAAEDGRLSPVQRQLQKISIFAHAELVIVAADGPNEDYGLRGIKELPEAMPRHLTQSIIPFGDRELLVRNFQHDCNRTRPVTKYFKLGSTFEEYIYSRRRLIFHRNSIVFECRRCTRIEDARKSREEAPWDCNYIEFMHDNGFPSLTVYMYLVDLINRREFALANDVLPAFATTLSTLRTPMPGGFLQGLPEMFFDVALLWQPAKDVTLRLSIRNPANEGPAPPPTWSWAAWAGKLADCSWASGTDFSATSRGLLSQTGMATVPITTWQAGDGPAGERRRVDTQWALWRETYRDESAALPPGWSRRKHVPGSNRGIFRPGPDGFGKYLYTHVSNSYDYWFPVPLSDPDPPMTPYPEPRYLFGRVSKMTLRARLEDQERSRCISLVDADGQWVGALRLHNRSDKPVDGAELDLVAISRGSLPKDYHLWMDIDKFEAPFRFAHGVTYEFYNVLWVKWVEGVAYRNGLGRVSKAAWDSQPLEEIELMLG